MSDARNEFRHSTFYHNYFEGYTETLVPKKNGKGKKILRVYSSSYIHQSTKKGHCALQRFAMACLTAGSIVLYAFGASAPEAAGLGWYADLPIALSAILIFPLLLFTVLKCFTPMMMTRWQYKTSHQYFMLVCRLFGIFLAISGVAVLADRIAEKVLGNAAAGNALVLCAVLFFVGAFLSGLVVMIEKKTSYEVVENDNAVPEEGNEIW